MIRDSIKKGEFSNLPGQGRPLKREWENPVLDNMEQKINLMIGNSGFTPEWITLDKEITADVKRLKGLAWNKIGPHPLSQSDTKEWERDLEIFQELINDTNKKIKDRNLKVLLLGKR